MAGVKWRELLDPSTGQPFKNYYRYRNWLAQQEGFRSYAEKRKLRRQGIYTTPGNARPRRPGGTKITPTKPSITPLDLPKSITRTNFKEASAKIQSALDGWKSGGWISNVTPASRAISRDEYVDMLDSIDRVFGNGDGSGDYVREVWEAGYRSVGANPRHITPYEKHYMVQETEQIRDRLTNGVDTMRQSAAAWDRGAKRVQTQEQAEGYYKRNPKITAEKYANGTRIDMRFLEEQVYARIHGTVYQSARLHGMKSLEQGTLVIVSDGPGCGWEKHGVGPEAHGMILPIEEAMRQPQAHPFCRRRFDPYRPDKDHPDWERAKKLAQQLKAQRRKAIAAEAAKASGTAALVAGVLGLATTELKLQLGDALLQGTIGNILVNSVGPLVRRAAENLIALQQRVISVLQMSPTNREIAARVTEAASKLREEFPALNYTQEQAEAMLMERLHAESLAWQQTADSSVISLATKRILKMPEVITEKVVGDSFEDFEGLYRLKFYNQIPDGEDAVTFMANMMESQNIFVQSFLDSMAPLSGRFGRFSLPKINVLEGNVGAGKRATHRYARFSLNPNDLVHTHLSVKPLRDGTLRTVKNIKINPNGLVRFGFVKDEKGVITPNMSLVPRGPLRIYSRINRSAAWITERGTNNLIPNPAKGRFNSITTEVKLLTPWMRWNESVAFKFRLNLASLGIHHPRDIFQIDWPQFRAFLQTNNPKHFKMVSAAADMNVRGFNMFEFKNTLRIDENGMWAWRAGINEIEQSIQYLLSLYKNEMMTARVEDTSYLEALFRAHAESLVYFRGKGLEYRGRIEAARTQLGGRWRDLGGPPEDIISWKSAQWIFHMAQREVAQRVDDLTDILVSYRRKSIVDKIAEPGGIKLADAQRVYVLTESKADQRWALQHANLVTAFLEADYVEMAKRMSVEVLDLEKRAQEIVGIIERLLTRHLNAVPERFREATLARLEKLQIKAGVLPEGKPLSRADRIVTNSAEETAAMMAQRDEWDPRVFRGIVSDFSDWMRQLIEPERKVLSDFLDDPSKLMEEYKRDPDSLEVEKLRRTVGNTPFYGRKGGRINVDVTMLSDRLNSVPDDKIFGYTLEADNFMIANVRRNDALRSARAGLDVWEVRIGNETPLGIVPGFEFPSATPGVMEPMLWRADPAMLERFIPVADVKGIVNPGTKFRVVDVSYDTIDGRLVRTLHMEIMHPDDTVKGLAGVADIAPSQSADESMSWGKWYWIRKSGSMTPDQSRLLMTPGSRFSAEDIDNPLVFRRLEDRNESHHMLVDAFRSDPSSDKWKIHDDDTGDVIVRFVIDGKAAVRDGKLVGRYEVVDVEDVLGVNERPYNVDMLNLFTDVDNIGDIYDEFARVSETTFFSGRERVRLVYLRQVNTIDETNSRHLKQALTQMLNDAGSALQSLDPIERAKILSETFPSIAAAAEKLLMEGRYLARTEMLALKQSSKYAVPFTYDKDGFMFAGYHVTWEPEWKFDPNASPTDIAQAGDASLFFSLNPLRWKRWVLRNMFKPYEPNDFFSSNPLDALSDSEVDQLAKDKLFAYEVWVKGGPKDITYEFDASYEMIAHKGTSVRVGKKLTWDEVAEAMKPIYEMSGVRAGSGLESEELQDLGKIIPISERLPGHPDQWISSHIGKSDAKGRVAKVLLDLLSHAPVTTTRLYKSLEVSDAQLQKITVGERVIDMMGLWTADSGSVMRGVRNAEKSQVIFIAKKSRYVNLEPFTTKAISNSFLVSGEFKITNVLTQIRDNGSVITWVELDYIRGAVI